MTLHVYAIIFGILYIAVPLTVLTAMYWQWKLFRHLRIFHYDRWVEITTLFGMAGMANSFKGIPYLYGNLDMDDPVIFDLKHKIRKYINWFVVDVVLIFLTFGSLFYFGN